MCARCGIQGMSSISGNPLTRAQALHEQCYAHVVAVLRYLIKPDAAGGAGERLQRNAQLSADDRAAFLKALLQVRALP